MDDDELAYRPLDDLVDRSETPEGEAEPEAVPWWRRRPRVSRVIAGVLVVLALYYLVSLVQVVQAGRSDSTEPVDAIVVLGAAQYLSLIHI